MFIKTLLSKQIEYISSGIHNFQNNFFEEKKSLNWTCEYNLYYSNYIQHYSPRPNKAITLTTQHITRI